MGRFYLAPYVGTGAVDDPFKPPVSGEFSAVDLRGDVTTQSGWCLVRVPAPEPISGALDLGDDLDGSMPRGISQTLENRLGLTLDDSNRLRAIIPELLLLHGTAPSDRTRWNRLRATRGGLHQIIIGGELVYRAPAVVGTIITEDFNKANNGLGPLLTWAVVNGTFVVASNRAQASSGSGDHSARAESDLAGVDHYAQAEDWNGGTSSNRPGVSVRFSSSADTHYRATNRHDATAWRVQRLSSGSTTDISTVASQAGAGGKVMRLEVNGSSLTGIYNGTTYSNDTDSVITTGTRTGIAGTHNGANRNVWDNFAAADLTVPDPTDDGSGAISEFPISALVEAVGPVQPEIFLELGTETDTAAEATLVPVLSHIVEAGTETDTAAETPFAPVLFHNMEVGSEIDTPAEVALSTERSIAVEPGAEADIADEVLFGPLVGITIEVGTEADTAADVSLLVEPVLNLELASETDAAADSGLTAERAWLLEAATETDSASNHGFGPALALSLELASEIDTAASTVIAPERSFILEAGTETDNAQEVVLELGALEPEFEVELGTETDTAVEAGLFTDLAVTVGHVGEVDASAESGLFVEPRLVLPIGTETDTAHEMLFAPVLVLNLEHIDEIDTAEEMVLINGPFWVVDPTAHARDRVPHTPATPAHKHVRGINSPPW